MEEFLQRGQKEQKAEQEWLNKFRGGFERAFGNIERHQERKLAISQIILLALVGGFFLDVLASAIYNIVSSLGSSVSFQVLELNISVSLVSSGFLLFIFGILWWQLSQYTPALSLFGLAIVLEDTKPFMQESQFQKIEEFLRKGALKDFRTFGDKFFTNLETLFSFMFGDKVSNKSIKQSEEFEEPIYKQFPTLKRKYDVSRMSRSGVKMNLEVILLPHVVYGRSSRGDETATYSFTLILRFTILNPWHKSARDVLDYCYYAYAADVLRFSSMSILNAFKGLGVLKNSSS